MIRGLSGFIRLGVHCSRVYCVSYFVQGALYQVIIYSHAAILLKTKKRGGLVRGSSRLASRPEREGCMHDLPFAIAFSVSSSLIIHYGKVGVESHVRPILIA